MSKKIYKGYELIKAIADGEIKEGSRFIDNYTEYIYEKDKLCNEELTLYRKDVFTGIWESPDYSLFVDNENEFELIEEDTIEIETIVYVDKIIKVFEDIGMCLKRLSVKISSAGQGSIDNYIDRYDYDLQAVKQLKKEIKELKEK